MKKKILKIFLIIVGIIVVFAAGGLSYIKFALPSVAAPAELKVDVTEERVKHGEYLANHVAVCMDCHSKRDWSAFSAPLVPGTLGQGGEMFPEEFGFPGTYYSRNITPAGIGNWTDGELYRAITSGVSKDGHALFPVMPYTYYSQMDKEDIYDIMAYIRSLQPVENTVPESHSNFPMNFIINTIPSEPKHQEKPKETDKVAYGKYMATMAACIECHTQFKDGQLVAGMEYAGGREFPMPYGMLRTPNLTPDKETGIGEWTEEQFVQRFKMYADSGYTAHKVAEGQFNTIMPWVMYAGMKEGDLKAIYAYLQTLPAKKNAVVKFEPAQKLSQN